MAIANTNNDTYSINPDVVIPAGNNRFVLILLGGDNAGSGQFDPPDTMTLEGLSMTCYADGSTAQEVSQIWGVVIPNTMAAGTYTATYTGTNVQRWFSSVFTGVSRDPVVDADIVYNIATNSNGSTLTADCVDGGWVQDVVYTTVGKDPTAGQTVIYNQAARPGVSYFSNVSAGTSTLNWVWAGDRFSHSIVSLRPHKGGSGIIMF